MKKILFFKKPLMINNLNKYFYLMLIFSTLITINSSSWISAWMGMEINLLSFIPLLINKSKSSKNSISTMSYFIIQASSSSMMIMSIMLMKLENNLIKINLIMMILQFSLILKIGASPFHWWLTKIINYINWKNCFIILSWQKIAPLFMLMNTNTNMIIYMTMIFSSITGAISGINQTSLKLIMTYSSINHLSWMMMALMINHNLMIFYLLMYLINNLLICLMLEKMNLNYLNQLFYNNKMMNKFIYMLMITLFMSMAGIPPFVGFLPKLMILTLMIKNFLWIESIIFIMTTLITLSFYMNPILSGLIINKINQKWNMMNNYYIQISYILLINFFLSTITLLFLMNNLWDY
uniref:NADH dehydrogenase subunit 2 n=1 Tax=Augomonoctenus smithi TaxID=1519147 RepID=UPI0023F238ED|nr:NADH dehydrogenase subunit 2 [Augomonoctenus smithi]WDY84667.1 NADH dehydrogenase subunit 2 [Augomonoctenus smithi]